MNSVVKLVRDWKIQIGNLINALPMGKTLENAIIDGDIGGGAEIGATYSQVTLNNITGSSGTPYVTDITIPITTDFKRQPVEILKWVPGGTDVVTTVCDFNVGDVGNFSADQDMAFDGALHPKTAYAFTVSTTPLGTGYTFGLSIDKTRFKNISSIT